MRVALGGNITVSALEKFYAEIRAGRAFAYGAARGSVAGQYGYVQLMNPAESGVSVIVYAARASRTIPGSMECRTHNAALGAVAGQGTNLLLGGAAGLAAVRTGSNAVQQGTAWITGQVPAYTLVDFSRDWTIELPAGQSILFTHDTVNERVEGQFFWLEL